MRISLTVLTAVLLALTFTSPAKALTVSPATLEITVDPGQVYTGEVEIFNEQDSTKTFYTSFENFEPQGNSGAPYFIGAKDGLATWIKSEDAITIESGQRVPVAYTISVPENAKPGGYFAAFFFGTQPPTGEKGGEVSIGGKIGILILLRVSGDIEESAGIANFSATRRVVSTLPVSMEYSFTNTGGDRVVPKGEVVIINTFGKEVVMLLANENNGSVLPASTRAFTVQWQNEEAQELTGFFSTALSQIKDFHFGRYKANLSLTWGQSGQTGSQTEVFYIVPWQLLTIVVLMVGGVGFGGRRALKSYNQRIISKALAAQKKRSKRK